MACIHSPGRGTTEVELGGRVVSMTPWPWPTFGRNDALLLEVADHPWRQADRLTGRADAWPFCQLVVEWLTWHAM